jgi:site-specific DNA-methyltransferase (adenine-specific)
VGGVIIYQGGSMIELLNEDCMAVMARYPDNHFDLAIVDPPYGIDMDGGKIGGDNLGKAKDYIKKDWDKEAPNEQYFKEIQRVSKNQIIWGANHFISRIPLDSPCWIVWDKDNSGNFADCELAYTSFKTAVKKFKFTWNGMIQNNMKDKEIRIHPTQKPAALYRWLLENYSEKGQKILDTHLGSGSSAIAAHYFGVEFVGCEIDKDYFKAAQERFDKETRQVAMF